MATEEIDVPRMGSRDINVPWYNEALGHKLGPVPRKLLETYSKIPSEEVESHVYQIRQEAWDIFPYPCIGGFRFLDLAITSHPSYPLILNRLQTQNAKLLDLGCCFGQELRPLVAAGCPSENLYGSDLRPEFFDLGYKLFKDKDSFKSTFIAADIFDPENGLKVLEGKIDIIYAASFLHLFSYEKQVQICKILTGILKEEKGAMVLGRQVGNVKAGSKSISTLGKGASPWRHDEESFKNMWKEVGEATGTEWRVEFEFLNDDEQMVREKEEWREDGQKRIRFAVFRE